MTGDGLDELRETSARLAAFTAGVALMVLGLVAGAWPGWVLLAGGFWLCGGALLAAVIVSRL